MQIRPNDQLLRREKILQVKAIVDMELDFLSSTNSSSIDSHTNSYSPELSTSGETAISLKNKTVFLYIVQKELPAFVLCVSYPELINCSNRAMRIIRRRMVVYPLLMTK